jgi:muconolactone delta-isomerase
MTLFEQWKTLEQIKPSSRPRKWNDSTPTILLDELGLSDTSGGRWSRMGLLEQQEMKEIFVKFVSAKLKRYSPLEYGPAQVSIQADDPTVRRFFDFDGTDRRRFRIPGWYLGMANRAFNLCRLPDTVPCRVARHMARRMAGTVMMDLRKTDMPVQEQIRANPQLLRLARLVWKYKELNLFKEDSGCEGLFALLSDFDAFWSEFDKAWIETRSQIPTSMYFGSRENTGDVI